MAARATSATTLAPLFVLQQDGEAILLPAGARVRLPRRPLLAAEESATLVVTDAANGRRRLRAMVSAWRQAGVPLRVV